MSDLIGKTVSGRYRIESFLGKGGMAEVYKVWDLERNVHLAMKILHADLAEDRIFLRRFKREAQTLEKLQHPNIVRFYGLEEDGDLVYMLMDYVDGTTLRKEIFQAKAPLSTERIQEVMKSVCAALYYAHKSGFVHCDIKPANVMIHSNGNVFLADFGISRMTEASTATMVGAGTPAYMSPEQIKGADPAPQMDIYALGIVLFEMLTGGERPFTGESAKTTGTTSEKVRWEQLKMMAPPPSMYNPSILSSMDAIALKCLDKTPQNRYLSAMDLYGDLISQGNASVQAGPVAPRQQPVDAPVPLPQRRVEQEPTMLTSAPAQKYDSISQPSEKKNIRSLKTFVVLGVGVLCVFLVFWGITGVGLNSILVIQATSTARSTFTPPPPTHTSFPTATPTFTKIPSTSTPEFLQYYKEEFAKDLKYWASIYVVDAWTGVVMKEPDVTPRIVSESISFDLPKYRWAYIMYDPFEYEDVRVEAEAENLGTNNNNVSLICRHSKLGWYEFNVANNGLYWIYYASIREDGFVAYKLLEQGGSNKIIQGNTPGKNLNVYAITCKGDMLTLYINGSIAKEFKDTNLKSGKIGVSISSFNTAANVKFNWIKISQP